METSHCFEAGPQRPGELRRSSNHAGTYEEEEQRLISYFQCFGKCYIYSLYLFVTACEVFCLMISPSSLY